MPPAAVNFRPYRPGDEVEINDGFNAVFGLNRSLEEWGWKFPVDAGGRTIMVAESEGEILAHYAGVPVRLQLDGRVWPAAQIVDVYSKRSARSGFTRRGVWVQTVERFFATFGESGRLALLYGFPSPRPLRLGVLQLGYDAMTPQAIDYLRRTRAPQRRPPRTMLYRAELARDWEPRLDTLWTRLRHQYPAAVVRDADHALRRFAGRPGVRYHRFLVYPRLSRQPVAWVVFRGEGGSCRWVDLLWDHDHPGALELVSRLGSRLAAQTGCAVEELWLNGDGEGRERLEEMGFDMLPEPRQLVLVAKPFPPDLDVRSLEGRIYLTMADSDLE